MLKPLRPLIAIVLFGAMLLGTGLSVSAQRRAYNVSDWQVSRLLQNIDAHATTFRRSLAAALNRTSLDNTRREDNVNDYVRDFDASVTNLRDRFRGRRDVSDDVMAVLNQAASINSFMIRHRLSPQAESDWGRVRSDLEVLARYYNVSWNWNGQEGIPRPNPAANRLTGTYRLDVSQSDDVERVARQATRRLSNQEQQRVSEMLSQRLYAPERLAIDRNGRAVTVASSRGPQVTFEADGRDRIEQTPRGRNVRVNASLRGDQMIVSSIGDRGNDFRITFDPIDNGRRLRVTRSLEIERLNQPVIVHSIYDRTSDIAELNLYNDHTPVGTRPRDGAYFVRDGEQLIATLNDDLTTKQARDGDRFTMTVQSPPNLNGATLEGHVSAVDRSGRVSGRSEMALNFDRIRLRNGASYNFEGIIDSVRTTNGEDVRVDNEGTVAEEDSQTKRTVTRGGIGAALGALIGAIAGGGKGAAVGAVVGAGAGAGSVFIQGRDDLDLLRGTQFTIRSAAPRAER